MTMAKVINAILLAMLLAATGCDRGKVLKGSDRMSTPVSYRPPVEITIVAKTDKTNLRMAYAADQVIFNWELDPAQLRIDGGPADGLHRPGYGRIPIKKYVT